MRLRSAATLCALMDQWGISTRELAKHVGMHHSAVDHLRSGRRDRVHPDTARRIAECLHATLPLLFYEDPVAGPTTRGARSYSVPARRKHINTHPPTEASLPCPSKSS